MEFTRGEIKRLLFEKYKSLDLNLSMARKSREGIDELTSMLSDSLLQEAMQDENFKMTILSVINNVNAITNAFFTHQNAQDKANSGEQTEEGKEKKE